MKRWTRRWTTLALTGLLGLSTGAGAGCGPSKPAEPAKSAYTVAGLRKECLAYCSRKAGCFKEICRTDYPGSASEFEVSVVDQQCVTNTCETDAYLNMMNAGDLHISCTLGSTCREVMTGKCGDIAVCTEDPGSTPFMPGSSTEKAKPPCNKNCT